MIMTTAGKRKHRSSDVPDLIVLSASHKKKEKRHKVASFSQDALVSHNHELKSPKSKGKSRALSSGLPSDFCTINASLVLSIAPVFASNLRAGAEEMLDSMIMRYVPSLQGVLLAHSNIRFMRQTASIHGACPFAVCNVSFDATVWAPRVSMKLVGRINLCSPDHISLLVHRTFNVSIPRHHIPNDQWVFEYGPAENDPEFGEGRDAKSSGEPKGPVDGKGDAEMIDSSTQKESEETRGPEGGGRWVHHLTGSKLGDPDGYVEFTVIGLTIANEMLSLQGSIQPNPFSPEHAPHPDKEVTSLDSDQDETPEIEVQNEIGGEEEEEEVEDSDEDGFKHLAMLTDQAQATQKAQRAEEEADRLQKEKKRKRRDGRSEDCEGVRHDKKAERKRKKKEAAS